MYTKSACDKTLRGMSKVELRVWGGSLLKVAYRRLGVLETSAAYYARAQDQVEGVILSSISIYKGARRVVISHSEPSQVTTRPSDRQITSNLHTMALHYPSLDFDDMSDDNDMEFDASETVLSGHELVTHHHLQHAR
jgi:hypothetical protein